MKTGKGNRTLRVFIRDKSYRSLYSILSDRNLWKILEQEVTSSNFKLVKENKFHRPLYEVMLVWSNISIKITEK